MCQMDSGCSSDSEQLTWQQWEGALLALLVIFVAVLPANRKFLLPAQISTGRRGKRPRR